MAGGSDKLLATVQSAKLQAQLSAQQIPVRISADAGAFLCEETLYVLETMKMKYASIKMVVFVHLPPYGSNLSYGNEVRSCDNELLYEFADLLLNNVKNLSQENQLKSEQL